MRMSLGEVIEVYGVVMEADDDKGIVICWDGGNLFTELVFDSVARKTLLYTQTKQVWQNKVMDNSENHAWAKEVSSQHLKEVQMESGPTNE